MLINNDNIQALKELEDNSIDSVVTDPPYGLSFMAKKWDYDVPSKELWFEVFRVLKPGGHLLSFGGSKTYHRLAVAIEDAGFEIRDQIMWVYGSGFPKSLNIGKAVDKINGVKPIGRKEPTGGITGGKYTGAEDKGWHSINNWYEYPECNNDWKGWGTALKPAHEPICMARKPLSEKTVAENCLKWGTGGINIDESRVGTEERTNKGMSSLGVMHDDNWIPQDVENTVTGRFPANLIHDNSEEVRECFPEVKGKKPFKKLSTFNFDVGGEHKKQKYESQAGLGETGNASRFFKSIIYQAKASKKERNAGLDEFEKVDFQIGDDRPSGGSWERRKMKKPEPRQNFHPTVKPLKLMEYLIKMVTPKGGTVLDPFMGSGTTGIACKLEGFEFVGIEIDKEYFKIAKARIENTNPNNHI